MATISAVAPGAQIEAPEELDARALERLLQLGERQVGWIVEMRLCGARDAPRVRPHFRGEKREEAQPLRRIEPRVAVEQLAGDGDAGGFAAARDQRRASSSTSSPASAPNSDLGSSARLCSATELSSS